MVDFSESSQLGLWMYGKPEHLTWLRGKANHAARTALVPHAARVPPDPTEAQCFARGWTQRLRAGKESAADYEALMSSNNEGPLENDKGKAFLTSTEEATLVAWYAPKLATLIGPKAALSRLKRNSKVTATAALLYRRFFLSNSVMYYDPKAIMVAAAFLASKVRPKRLFICLRHADRNESFCIQNSCLHLHACVLPLFTCCLHLQLHVSPLYCKPCQIY